MGSEFRRKTNAHAHTHAHGRNAPTNSVSFACRRDAVQSPPQCAIVELQSVRYVYLV